jgi:hypothetical protein
MTHKILQTVEEELRKKLEVRAVDAIKQIRHHVEVLEALIRFYTEQKQDLEELQHRVLGAYDNVDTKTMDACAKRLQEIISNKVPD